MIDAQRRATERAPDLVALARRQRYDLAWLDQVSAFCARHLHQELRWLWSLPINELIDLHRTAVELLEMEGKIKREKEAK